MFMSEQIELVPGYHQCKREPKRNRKIKCNWCKKKIIGNSFKGHVCIEPKPKYMSYTVLGTQSVSNFFIKKPVKTDDNQASSEKDESL